jgi:hypothetical protein
MSDVLKSIALCREEVFSLKLMMKLTSILDQKGT